MAAPKKTNTNTPKATSNTMQSAPLSDRIIVLFILLATGVVFANSIFNDFIINWDDDGYIINNPLIKEFSLNGLKTIFTIPHLDNYHPLTTLSNAIELSLFGLNAHAFHFFNLVFHLINTYLVFRFVKMLSGRMEAAAITALLFAIHPMHVESVSWISERKDLLYTLFFLGSMIFYLRFIKDQKPITYSIALALFLGSLLSKPTAVVLSPVLLLLDYYKDRNFNIWVLLEKVPFFAMSIGFGLLAIHIQNASGSTALAPHFPVFERIFLASYTLVFYLIKSVAPFGLSALHLYPPNATLGWEYYAAPVVLLAIFLGTILSKKYRKDLVFALLFFVITISLVIQLIPVGRAIVGERYTYIPYIGLFFLLGRLYCDVMDGNTLPKIKQYLRPVLTGFVLMLMFITWQRNGDWQDSHTLFTKAIETNPDDYYGYFARGAGEVLLEQKAAALNDFSDCIRVNPKYADAYYSRGVLLEKSNPAGAMADYNAAIKIKPNYDEAYYNRGTMKIYANDNTGAIADFDSTLKYNPKYAEAYCNRGAMKANMGKQKEAIADYDMAIKAKPDLANAYYNRGSTYYALGDKSKACEDWHKALDNGYTAAKGDIDAKCK